MRNLKLRQMVLAAFYLALTQVLPMFTGQIPQIGRMLAPMHLPVMLAGFTCGPWWALATGLIAPPLRFVLFGMPPFPGYVAMAFELAVYGLVSGLLYRVLPKKPVNIYVSLVGAMLAGRAVWGLAMLTIMGMSGKSFGLHAFLTGAFTGAVPGIILQLVLVPAVVMLIDRKGCSATLKD